MIIVNKKILAIVNDDDFKVNQKVILISKDGRFKGCGGVKFIDDIFAVILGSKLIYYTNKKTQNINIKYQVCDFDNPCSSDSIIPLTNENFTRYIPFKFYPLPSFENNP